MNLFIFYMLKFSIFLMEKKENALGLHFIIKLKIGKFFIHHTIEKLKGELGYQNLQIQ